MARTTITTTEYTDDLDGSKAEGTVSFSFDGTAYEIDLGKKNAREFEKVMAPYVAAARRVRNVRSQRRSTSPSKHDVAAVRAWAKANGHQVAPRGRVPADVVRAFEAAGN